MFPMGGGGDYKMQQFNKVINKIVYFVQLIKVFL
jgi:hypothetical protein